jgi:N-acetylglucosaminyl-diphospho-decaprenol L-rhamnosyltransferase
LDAIIVTHNSAEDLKAQLTCPALRTAFRRIIVVDNASTDNSVEVARAAGVEVHAREQNDGLSVATNEGVRRSDSPVFALLNPDVMLDDPAVVAELEGNFEDPSLGAVAPALRLPQGVLQDSARQVPTPAQLVYRRLAGRRAGAIRSMHTTDVEWVVAAFMVVRRTAFDEVGGFDEGYRLYFEDVDFCVRLWSHGWRVRLNPQLVANHEHKAFSRKSLTSWATRQHVRSAARFYAQHPDLLLPTGRRRLVRPSH